MPLLDLYLSKYTYPIVKEKILFQNERKSTTNFPSNPDHEKVKEKEEISLNRVWLDSPERYQRKG